jgi:hypothetical protein
VDQQVSIDLPGAGTRKRGWRSHKRLIAVGAVLLVAAIAVFGATEGRALWHKYQTRPTAASHPIDQGQLSGLPQVQNPADNSNGQRAVGADKPSPSPPAPGPSAVLQVPYTVQAPNGNWKVFENACEEDVLLMYHGYLEGDHRDEIPPGEADPALRAMEQWQVSNWGADRDLTLDKTGQFAQAYYHYKYQVMEATPDNIKRQVSAGHPVIIPVMTHSLENHFYGPQTVYHEVLIKGYTDGGIVTNDGGVQQGKNWFYSWNIMFQAIDAQTPKLGQGRVALILTK